MNNNDELGYFSKNAAEQLGISSSSIRAWSIKLEEKGIEFERNENNQRIYFTKDIQLFAKMKELLDLQQPMEKVVKIIVEKVQPNNNDDNEYSENNNGKAKDEYELLKQKIILMEQHMGRIASYVEEIARRLETKKEKSREVELFQEKFNLALHFVEKMDEMTAKK